jgi:hypothetical protein
VSTLTLVADNGTWGVGVVASARDAALRSLRDEACWGRVVRAFPLIAHWTDAEPITEVTVMAKIEDRHRQYVVGGKPVATGVVPLADAWACSNPSLGRGISIGMAHAAALRRLVHEDISDPAQQARRWSALTDETVGPLMEETHTFDGHRLAEIAAAIDGRPYETSDDAWNFELALRTAAVKDPDLLRASIEIAMVLDTTATVLARPGLAERAHALADREPLPGPDRAQLLQLVAG